MQKPYLLRPVRGDQYELIIPKFVDFRADQSEPESEFLIFEVSRCINLLSPLLLWSPKSGKIWADVEHLLHELATTCGCVGMQPASNEVEGNGGVALFFDLPGTENPVGITGEEQTQ